MASSVAGTSTNDVTSTENHSMSSAPSMVVTTEVIMRECVRLGLYRNPVCNDKLYLHGKGYDRIDPAAFDPYTDVKVLWLEGNAIGSLACGSPFVQTAPPKRRDPFASESDSDGSAQAAEEGEEGGAEHETDVPRGQDGEGLPLTAPVGAARHVDPTTLLPGAKPGTTQPTAAAPTSRARKNGTILPNTSDVKPEEKDIFSSLYPTVRHIYLHNNVFRTMPDLHRFQRLHTVNLANNFFATVESGCPGWCAAQAVYIGQCDARRQLADAVSKSAARERVQSSSPQAPTQASEMAAADTASGAVDVVDPAVAAERRRQEMDAYRRYADAAVHFCPHESIPVEEGGADPKVVDRRYLQTCSSLRTLNLAGNNIESFEDYVGLLSYKALTSVDLSQNQIKDGELLLLVLERLPNLLSLKVSGNPCVRSMPRYRKRVLAACPKLMTLDDRPVFEEERRLVTAWAEGGDTAENAARKRIKEEKEAAQQKRLDDFRALLAQHRDGGSGAADAYVGAVSTPQALRRASGAHGPNESDDDSITSEETASDTTSPTAIRTDAENTVHRVVTDNGADSEMSQDRTSHTPSEPLVENRLASSPAGTGDEAHPRVLSSNRCPASSQPVDEDAADIYVP